MSATALDTNLTQLPTELPAPARVVAAPADSVSPDPDVVLHVGALGVLGAQVLLIALVHVLGI